MSPIDEGLYASLMAPRLKLWQERASAAVGETRVSYAVARAKAIARPYHRKLARCTTRGLRVKCGCKGWRGIRAYTCRQHLLCESCQRQRGKRLGQRIRAGLEAAMAGADAGAKVVLLTITLRHTGDVEADRRELAAGWRRFYKSMWSRFGKFPYVGVWEVTPGRDALGHVHAHIAAIWPWRDWSVCAALWREACPSSERISFVASRRDKRPSDPRSVANYLGKYLSKGIQGGDFSPELRARVVAGTYNTRWVFTSRAFWQHFAPCCKACGQPVIAAQYRFCGEPYRPDDATGARGDPQASLELPEPYQRTGGRCAR